jgi:hypothetical protein
MIGPTGTAASSAARTVAFGAFEAATTKVIGTAHSSTANVTTTVKTALPRTGPDMAEA